MDLITINPLSDGTIHVGIRQHQYLLERSLAEGGKDQAPSPVEAAVASLGACIGLMVGDYCRRNRYQDGEVGVYLSFQMGGSPKRIEAITVDIELPKDVPQEKREAIRRIAEHCPVHQTLASQPRIDLEIV